MKLVEPYVGITGFMDRAEVDQCLRCLPESGGNIERKLMVGVLVSSLTISGRINSLWRKFPRRERFAQLFGTDRRVFNCLHFATRQPDKLYDDLMLCHDYAGENLHGFQLNLPWPSSTAISRVKDQDHRLKFVLQVSPHESAYANMDCDDIVERFIKSYSGLADYVLIDFSRGHGQDMPTQKVTELLAVFQSAAPYIKPVGGGGLCADNVKTVIGGLLPRFPGLSWDAEGKLRDDADSGGNMDMAKTVGYLKKSYKLAE